MTAIKTNFSVDSALLKELGERLVTTPHVALAELVKNAYDADATEARVTVRTDDSTGGPVIQIKDNGSGMTLEQIRSYWMRIGTTHKQSKNKSQRYGRPVSGSKGIGRFCVRRLGTKVHVESCAKVDNHYEHINLEIDWDKFVSGEEVNSVDVLLNQSIKDEGVTGVTLTMSGRDKVEWYTLEDKRSYNYLLRQMATLSANVEVEREGYEKDPGFKVFLSAPALEYGHAMSTILGFEPEEEDEEWTIDMRDKLMHAGWGTLTAKVGTNGRISCSLDAKSPVGKQKHESTISFKYLKDVNLKLGIFVDESGWNRNENLVPRGKLREILFQWGGVQLRHNAMRVYPYGEPNNDWLGIDRDRARRLASPQGDLLNFASTLKARSFNLDPHRALLNMLSSSSYLGSIEVGENQDGLDPKADREGFIENATFLELRQFARYAIDWAMIWRDYAVRERVRDEIERNRIILERKSDDQKPIPQAKQSEAAISVVRRSISRLKRDPSSASNEDFEILSAATSLIEAELKTTKADMFRFQLVASASTLSLLYNHEIRYLTQTLGTLRDELKRAIKQISGELKQQLEVILNTIKLSQENLDGLSDLTQDMGILDQNEKAISLDLAYQVDKAIQRFKRIRDSYTIEIASQVPEGLLVGPMLKGEISAILLNSLSNAIKAVISGNGQRTIEFSAHKQQKRIHLLIKDTGIGLSKEERENVFSPLVSDPDDVMYDEIEERVAAEDRFLLGQGTGLGLSIIRGILENRSGKAEFIEPESGWSTCLCIELPTPS